MPDELYEPPDVLADPDAVFTEMVETYEAENAGRWAPDALAPEVLLMRAGAPIAAELRETMARHAGDYADLLSANVLRIPRLAAAATSVTSRWTARDDVGDHEVEEGAQLDVGGFTFQTVEQATIAPGATFVDVIAVAVELGAAANELPAGDAAPITRYTWLDSVATVTVTAGGRDLETNDDYRDRATRESPLLGVVPQVPEHFERYARRIPRVKRVVALDGYQPSDDTFGHGRMVTLVVVTTANGDPNSADEEALAALFLPVLGVNWTVHVRGAWWTDVQVTYHARALPGYDRAAVESAADAAVAAVLSADRYGLQDGAGEAIDAQTLPVRTLVPIGEVLQAVENTPGIDYCSEATLASASRAAEQTSLPLTGRVPLPNLTAIASTVDPA